MQEPLEGEKGLHGTIHCHTALVTEEGGEEGRGGEGGGEGGKVRGGGDGRGEGGGCKRSGWDSHRGGEK